MSEIPGDARSICFGTLRQYYFRNLLSVGFLGNTVCLCRTVQWISLFCLLFYQLLDWFDQAYVASKNMTLSLKKPLPVSIECLLIFSVSYQFMFHSQTVKKLPHRQRIVVFIKFLIQILHGLLTDRAPFSYQFF